jgi:hypothetical protein
MMLLKYVTIDEIPGLGLKFAKKEEYHSNIAHICNPMSPIF